MIQMASDMGFRPEHCVVLAVGVLQHFAPAGMEVSLMQCPPCSRVRSRLYDARVRESDHVIRDGFGPSSWDRNENSLPRLIA